MTRVQANLLLLLTAAMWGGGFVVQSLALASIAPLWFVGLRFAIGGVCVLPFAVYEARKAKAPLSRRHLLGFIFIGLLLFAGSATQQIGQMTTTVTNSSFLTGLYVVFVPVISLIFLRKKPHWIIWPGALMATTGIFLLSGGAFSQLTTGDILTVICAVFWALQLTMVGIFVAESDRPLTLSMVQFFTCAFSGILSGAAFEPISMASISGAAFELLYVGIFSCGLGFVLQVIAQRYTTAPQAAVFLSSEALFGALFGALILGDHIGLIGYIGCGIIFVAMLIVELVPTLTDRTSKTTSDDHAGAVSEQKTIVAIQG